MDSKPENKIDYLELHASDIEASKRFYSAVFGWKFEDYGPEYTSFHDGRLTGGFTTRIPALVQGQTKIREAGGTIVKDAFSFPGGRRFHFADPNGNELAVWSDQ